MPLTIPPALTPAPTPAPQRGDSTTFSTRVDALMTWLANAATQFSDLATNVYDNAVIAGTSAATAEAAATLTKWISGTAYIEGNVVWSPINFLAYRCKVTGTYTTDPSADATNWAAISPSITSDKDASNGYPGLTLFKINFKNVAGTFTSFFTNTNTAARTYTFPDKDGTVAMTSDITAGLSTSPTLGIGFATGAGNTVTQLTSKSTAVTINTVTGKIVTHNEVIAAGGRKFFFVNNSAFTNVNDIIVLTGTPTGASGTYTFDVDYRASGQFRIAIYNWDTATHTEAININFAIVRSVTA